MKKLHVFEKKPQKITRFDDGTALLTLLTTLLRFTLIGAHYCYTRQPLIRHLSFLYLPQQNPNSKPERKALKDSNSNTKFKNFIHLSIKPNRITKIERDKEISYLGIDGFGGELERGVCYERVNGSGF